MEFAAEIDGIVLVCSEVTKYLAFAKIPNYYIMSANLYVFRDARIFTFCQSSIHYVWARQHSARLETRLKYSPGNAFETFPFPDLSYTKFNDLGERLHCLRENIMQTNSIGLTKLYNRYHDLTDSDPDVKKLRELHGQVDVAVARSYCWDDISLGHGFHEVPSLPAKDRCDSRSRTRRGLRCYSGCPR